MSDIGAIDPGSRYVETDGETEAFIEFKKQTYLSLLG